MNGSSIAGRVVTVAHKKGYEPPEEEQEDQSDDQSEERSTDDKQNDKKKEKKKEPDLLSWTLTLYLPQKSKKRRKKGNKEKKRKIRNYFVWPYNKDLALV